MALTDDVKRLIEEALPGSEVEVIDEGGGDHLRVIVAAPQFAGQSRIDQHRLVNEALAEPLRDGTIHELRIKTKGSE